MSLCMTETFPKRQNGGQTDEVRFISHSEYISIQPCPVKGYRGFTCGFAVSAGHLIRMRNILICQCGVGADGMSRPLIGVSIR